MEKKNTKNEYSRDTWYVPGTGTANNLVWCMCKIYHKLYNSLSAYRNTVTILVATCTGPGSAVAG